MYKHLERNLEDKIFSFSKNLKACQMLNFRHHLRIDYRPDSQT
jgi:hypothetical protein